MVKNIKDKALEKGIEALNMQEFLKLKRNFPQDYEGLKVVFTKTI